VGILLPNERYWDIPETEDINLEMMEPSEFRDKDEREIQRGGKNDNEIQTIKKNLDEERKERKGVELGLCQWKDGLSWYQGKIWIPNDERLRTSLITKHH